MASPMRIRRLERFILREVGNLLQSRMKDPRIGIVSVTSVQLSRDMRRARVRVSVLGGDAEKNRTMAALRRARGFVQSVVAGAVELRNAPVLSFELDESIERSIHIDRLIRDAVAEDREAAEARGEVYTPLPEGATSADDEPAGPENVAGDGEEGEEGPADRPPAADGEPAAGPSPPPAAADGEPAAGPSPPPAAADEEPAPPGPGEED